VSRPGGIPEVVRRAQAGDQDAFHTLYREQAGRVFALCLRLVGDRVAVESQPGRQPGEDGHQQALVLVKIFKGLSQLA